jgi:hypothetical protein
MLSLTEVKSRKRSRGQFCYPQPVDQAVGDDAVTKHPEPQSWRSYEDAFRRIVAQHDVFGLDSVEPTARHAEGSSGHVWDIEVIGYTCGHRKMVIFEVRKKSSSQRFFANPTRSQPTVAFFTGTLP